MFYTTRSILLFAILGFGGCEPNGPTAAPPDAGIPTPEFLIVPASLGPPLRTLSGAQRRQFEMGRVVFSTVFTPQTGLGPLFNSVGCANCHEQPVVGGSGNNDPAEGGEDVEVHATAFHAGARCDDLAAVRGPGVEKQVTPAPPHAPPIPAEPTPAPAPSFRHRT